MHAQKNILLKTKGIEFKNLIEIFSTRDARAKNKNNQKKDAHLLINHVLTVRI